MPDAKVIQNKISMFPLEKLSSFWSAATAVFTGLAAISGMFALMYSNRLSDEKDEIRKRDKEESAVAVATADARAAEAKQEAAKANEHTAKLENDAALARLELEQIKEKQRPRIISQEQRTKFISLVGQTEKGPVRLHQMAQNNETNSFVVDLQSMFEAAGYPKPISIDNTIGGPIMRGGEGISHAMLLKKIQSPPVHARILQIALKHIGIEMPAIETVQELVPVAENEVVIAITERR